jgi:fucose permease
MIECMRDAGLVVVNQESSGRNENKFKSILGMKGVHILACFAFVYVGIEVTIGGELHILVLFM